MYIEIVRKTINFLSAVLSVLLVGITLAVGWYQIAQIVDFMPNGHGYKQICDLPINKNSGQCTIWPDRFGMIAMGIVVPVTLSPFILIFLNTMKNPWLLKKRLVIWLSITAVSFMVYLSGITLYAIL